MAVGDWDIGASSGATTVSDRAILSPGLGLPDCWLVGQLPGEPLQDLWLLFKLDKANEQQLYDDLKVDVYMNWEILLFAVVLSIDSFSAAFAMGFRRFSARRAFAFAFSSAFAEGAATAVGFLLGHVAKDLIVNYDHWVAFFLLVAVGGHMCWVAFHHDPAETTESEDPRTHGLAKILFISTITSIDSVGVGVTLGLASKPIFAYSFAIALAAFAATYLGLNLAKRMPAVFGSRLEIFGGAVLIVLGFKMLSI